MRSMNIYKSPPDSLHASFTVWHRDDAIYTCEYGIHIGVCALFPLCMCEWTGMSEVAVVAVYKQFEQRPFW